MEFQLLQATVVLILGLLLGWGLASFKSTKDQKTSAGAKESSSYLKGLNYMIARQPDKAIAEFTKLVRLKPDVIEIYLSLGNLFREQGQVERAIRLHQSIILRPKLDESIKLQALLDLGLDYRKAGLVDRAISTYRQVISQQPEHLAAYRQLEQLYEEARDWSAAYMAERKLLRLTKSKDKSVPAHLQVQIGRAYHEQNNVKEALKRLKTAIELDKSCSEAYLYLGDIYLAQGKLKSAISSWEDMVKLGINFSCLAYSKLEEAYLAQNKYDKIREVYEKVLAKHPADIRTRLALAQYYQRLGKSELAHEEIKSVARLKPQNQLVRQFLLQLMISAKGKAMLTEYKQLFGWLKLADIPFQCEKCGHQTLDSPWKCPRCRQWDTFSDSLS